MKLIILVSIINALPLKKRESLLSTVSDIASSLSPSKKEIKTISESHDSNNTSFNEKPSTPPQNEDKKLNNDNLIVKSYRINRDGSVQPINQANNFNLDGLDHQRPNVIILHNEWPRNQEFFRNNYSTTGPRAFVSITCGSNTFLYWSSCYNRFDIWLRNYIIFTTRINKFRAFFDKF